MAAVLDSVRAFFAHNTFTIDQENPGDVVARENLLDRAMGPSRRRKSSEALRRNRVPAVGEIQPLERWLGSLGPVAPGELRLMMAPGADSALTALPAPAHVILLIGAEGGLDPQEMAAAAAAGFVAVRLGPRVLRTETAGLAALAAMQVLWGDFKGDDNV